MARNLFKDKEEFLSQAKDLDIKVLIEYYEGFVSVYEKRKEEYEKAQAEIKQRAERIRELREIIANENLTAEEVLSPDLLNDVVKQISKKGGKLKAVKNKVEPKYFREVNGQKNYWSGRGRAPEAFIEMKDLGCLDDCLISDEELALWKAENTLSSNPSLINKDDSVTEASEHVKKDISDDVVEDFEIERDEEAV